MTARPASAITLRALDGEPLAEPALRDMVVATAHAVAERQGIEVLGISTTTRSITAKLGCGRTVAIGLAVELRRLTTVWYTRKYGAATLWGEPPTGDEDTAEGWKTR